MLLLVRSVSLNVHLYMCIVVFSSSCWRSSLSLHVLGSPLHTMLLIAGVNLLLSSAAYVCDHDGLGSYSSVSPSRCPELGLEHAT